MDHEQYAQLKQTYSQMGDDELAYFVATRGAHLTEEAQSALTSVLKSRNPDAVDAMANIAVQVQAEEAKREKNEAEMRVVGHLLKLVKLGVLGGVLVMVPMIQLYQGTAVQWWLLLVGMLIVGWLVWLIFKNGRGLVAPASKAAPAPSPLLQKTPPL